MKKKRPKRRRPSPAARIRPFWIAILFVGGLLCAGTAFALTWPGFDPKSIRVSGNQRVPSSEILARAAIAPRVSVWMQNTGAMASRIEAIPYIETAKVHRVPPATVRIVVEERRPYVLLRSGDQEVVADRALRVLSYAGDERLPTLVLRPGLSLAPGTFVIAPEARTLRESLGAMAQHGFTVEILDLDRYGELEVTLESGPRLLLGTPTELPKKLALAAAIMAQVVRGQRRVAAIDVRAPQTPVVVYR